MLRSCCPRFFSVRTNPTTNQKIEQKAQELKRRIPTPEFIWFIDKFKHEKGFLKLSSDQITKQWTPKLAEFIKSIIDEKTFSKLRSDLLMEELQNPSQQTVEALLNNLSLEDPNARGPVQEFGIQF